MIPEIGIMIAGYIFVRVLHMITQPQGERKSPAVAAVVIFGIISMIATALISLDLIFGSRGRTAIPGL